MEAEGQLSICPHLGVTRQCSHFPCQGNVRKIQLKKFKIIFGAS
jgi:hypothetical protein